MDEKFGNWTVVVVPPDANPFSYNGTLGIKQVKQGRAFGAYVKVHPDFFSRPKLLLTGLLPQLVEHVEANLAHYEFSLFSFSSFAPLEVYAVLNLKTGQWLFE